MVRLVSWNQDEAQSRARMLRKAGITVDASPFPTAQLIGHLRAISPAVILIDLDRLPSHGRAVALVLRNSKTTRHIPLVFAGGAQEKAERIRRELSDAFFADWKTVPRALKTALKSAPVDPMRPVAYMARYAGASLVKKLGFKPGMKIALLGIPDGFDETLGELPDGIEFQTKLTPQTELAIWFVRSRDELDAAADYAGARLPEGSSIWIAHPKKSSRYRVDFKQIDVRRAGFASGLVDYKVCSVDADWSALRFARRREGRRRA